MLSIKKFFMITFSFLASTVATANDGKVDTLESKVMFGQNVLHKIEFDGPKGHEVHYFNAKTHQPYYICRKSCLEEDPQKRTKLIDQPLNGEKVKKIRDLKVFEDLGNLCNSKTERPSIKICEIANAPQIPGYNELLNSL